MGKDKKWKKWKSYKEFIIKIYKKKQFPQKKPPIGLPKSNHLIYILSKEKQNMIRRKNIIISYEIQEDNYKLYDWSTDNEEKAKDYKKDVLIPVIRKNIRENKYRSFKLITTIHNEAKKTVHLIKEVYNQHNFKKPFVLCDTIHKAYSGYDNKSKKHHKTVQKERKQKIEKQLTFNFG